MTTVEETTNRRTICTRRVIAFIVVSACLIGGCVYFYNESQNAEKNSDNTSVPIAETIGQDFVTWEQNEEIQLFREYLRIPSVHPDIDYEPCIEFLKNQAQELDLPTFVYYPVNDKNPVLVMTWAGSEPDLPSIVLNSHMDVVPVFEEFWTHPPFDAEMDERGNIYARGAQDMKSVGTQYLAAIHALKKDGIKQFKRTIHLIYEPDEEMGSHLGMREFVNTEPFKALNVGFVLDEGGASASIDEYNLFYAERYTWRIEFICQGKSGHGSIMFENTAAEKLCYLINKFSELLKIESAKATDHSLSAGRNVTSINLMVIKGGVEGNVVPPEMIAMFDVRLAVDADHDAFERQINQWCEEAGGNITIKYHIKDPKVAPSVIDDTNPFWTAFKSATDSLGLKIVPIIVSGATDSRFIRPFGVPCFGFSPIINTTVLAHDNDEYLNAATYLHGIKLYTRIITSLANMESKEAIK